MSTSTVEREEKPAFDPTKLPLLERVTRTVKEPWGHDELKSKVYEHDQLQRKIDGEEEALKTYASNKRNEIKELEEERKLLSHSMTDGMYVDVACEIRVDIEAGTKIVLRSDTLEVISETKLTDKDRQMALDLSATNDVFETMKQTLKDGMSAPPSRKARAGFMLTLTEKGKGGELVAKLHADGHLDPCEGEGPTADFLAPEGWAAVKADAESNLDDRELTLAQLISEAGYSYERVVELANEIKPPNGPSTEPICAQISIVRYDRAVIDRAEREISAAKVEACEPNEQKAEPKPNLKKMPKPKPDLSVPSMPSSRIMRSKSKADQKGRWKSASFWKAHDAGLLDPQEDDLTRALVDIGEGGLNDVAMAALETDLDAFEQDCIAEIEEDAKAQAKLDAGKYPTGQIKVDVAIGEVRWQRAKLDVAMSAVPA